MNLGEFFCPKQWNNNKYLEIKLKMFRRDDKAELRKHQQINLGESDFKQLLQLCNAIVVANVKFSREENLRLIVTSPLSQDLKEQMKHVQKAITIVDRPKAKIIATMKRYYLDKPDNSYVQVRHFMRKN